MDSYTHMELLQQQKMSFNQMQSLKILSYNLEDLENFLKNEYLENPMIEYTGNSSNDAEGPVTYGKRLQDLSAWSDRDENCDIPDEKGESIRDVIMDQLPKDFLEKDLAIAEYLTGCLEE